MTSEQIQDWESLIRVAMFGRERENEIARLEAVNAELVAALSVFADPSNWGYDRDLPRAWDNRDIRRPSDFAREALARALPQPLKAE